VEHLEPGGILLGAIPSIDGQTEDAGGEGRQCAADTGLSRLLHQPGDIVARRLQSAVGLA
jgi:hypothetical protein